MTRKKPVARDLEHENEVLGSIVDPVDTQAEDPLLQKVLSPEFVTMSNAEAGPLALALQELIRGQNSILGQQNQLGDQISKLAERMNKYDKAEAAWKRDQAKFIEQTIARSAKIKGKDENARARGLKLYQAELAQAKVVNASNRVKFEQDLAKMPQVDLIVAGRIEAHIRNGAQTADLMPEEIRIRHKVWLLKPGTVYKVPRIVKERYEQILLDRQENKERAALLDGSKQDTVVAAGMAAISSKYGTRTDAFPIASH